MFDPAFFLSYCLAYCIFSIKNHSGILSAGAVSCIPARETRTKSRKEGK